MQAVEGFVKENRGALSRNIKGLNRVSKVLVKQRDALDEVLQVAPTALSNLFHTYNPATGTLDTRSNLGENIASLGSDPAAFLCGLVAAGGSDAAGKQCSRLKGALPLPRSAPLRGTNSASVTPVEHVDRSLGGILEVQK
jgi:phospholipid/cholesterol/gamma-HCH transport system substrate-binding protein